MKLGLGLDAVCPTVRISLSICLCALAESETGDVADCSPFSPRLSLTIAAKATGVNLRARACISTSMMRYSRCGFRVLKCILCPTLAQFIGSWLFFFRYDCYSQCDKMMRVFQLSGIIMTSGV